MMPKTKKELELMVNPPIPIEIMDKLSVIKLNRIKNYGNRIF